MAERRMFAKQIIDSDAFLDMPLSAQSLYFHMAMRADDEGFVGNPRKIKKMIGASDDDLKLLLMKRYLLSFESGIIVIKHWKIHNYIQTDRFKPTTYIEEKSTLTLDEKKAYTECIQNVYKLDTQVSKDKERLEEVNIEPKAHAHVRKAQGTPSLEEVKGFFKANGLTLDAQRFYSFNAARGWVDKNGNPIEDWKQLALAWQAKEPKATKTHTYTEEQLQDLIDNIDEVEF